MKLFTGCVISVGLLLTATAANAQRLTPYEIGSPYSAVSDVDGPYAAMPPEAYPPRYGPMLLPPREVYTVVRESGFSPLGIPQQRGFIYTIAVINGGGDDGRLVIDARTGRILRFMPASRMGDNFNEDMTLRYGPVGPPPPIDAARGLPRPPAPLPHVASRTPPTPLPKPAPHVAGSEPKQLAAKPLAEKPLTDKPVLDKPLAEKPAPEKSAEKPAPEPVQQSASVQTRPADAPLPPQPAVPIVEAKPAPQIQPTQEMPKVQGLE